MPNLPSNKSDHRSPKRILTSKVVKDPEPDKGESTKALNPLDAVNPNRSCNCDVVARGIRDHVHMNIGMSERRDAIKRLVDECDTNCKKVFNEPAKTDSENKANNATKPKETDGKKSKTDEKNTCKICESLNK